MNAAAVVAVDSTTVDPDTWPRHQLNADRVDAFERDSTIAQVLEISDDGTVIESGACPIWWSVVRGQLRAATDGSPVGRRQAGQGRQRPPPSTDSAPRRERTSTQLYEPSVSSNRNGGSGKPLIPVCRSTHRAHRNPRQGNHDDQPIL